MNAVSHTTGAGKQAKPVSASIAALSPSIPKTLRYVEWAFLILVILRIGLLMLNRSLGYEPGTADYISFSVLGMLAVLSIVFPIEQPIAYRRAYIGLEIVVLLISRWFTDWGLDPFLYLVLVKSCFLLRRRDVIFITVFAGIAWQLSLAQRIFKQFSAPIDELREQFEASLEVPAPLLVLDFIVNSTTIYIVTCLLIILLCWTVLSERKSRQQAAALSQEVKILATALERTRIARDIHDSLGHTLTTLDVQLEVAHKLYYKIPGQNVRAVGSG